MVGVVVAVCSDERLVTVLSFVLQVAYCVRCGIRRRRRRRVYLMPLYNFDADFEDENDEEIFEDYSDTAQMLNTSFRSTEMEPVLEFEPQETNEK
jgi:hypothetical protein